MKKIKVGVLGATGAVGQRFVDLLKDHPLFELAELAASERSAGKTYEEAVAAKGGWIVSGDIPEKFRSKKVKKVMTDSYDCKIIFSALDADIARDYELVCARSGAVVCSNTKTFRWGGTEKDVKEFGDCVPLVIPEINGYHTSVLSHQRIKWDLREGAIVTNPNCTTIGLALTLKPLLDFGMKSVDVVTFQALSGAGYPGVSALDIIDNVIPYIKDEEWKVENEPLKILGRYICDKFERAEIKIGAQCNRVAHKDGHLECVTVRFDNKIKLEDVIHAFESFNPLKKLELPSSPEKPIIYTPKIDRPQIRYDLMAGNGMSVTVGTLKHGKDEKEIKYRLVSHNTIRGAAGASILNAEYMIMNNMI